MFTNFTRTLALAVGIAVVSGFSASTASAGPILNTAGQNLFATGSSITASFLHANAGDTSQLQLKINLTSVGLPFLFNNGSSAIGTTLSFGTNPGDSLVFTLQNLSESTSYSTGLASTNVSYTIFDGNIANLNNALFASPEALSAAAVAAVNALGVGALIISFEDRVVANSDKDFNDLIFGFKGVSSSVPEPSTIALIAMALFSLFSFGLMRRHADA